MKNFMYLIMCKFIQIHDKSNTFLCKIKMNTMSIFCVDFKKNKFF